MDEGCQRRPDERAEDDEHWPRERGVLAHRGLRRKLEVGRQRPPVQGDAQQWQTDDHGEQGEEKGARAASDGRLSR